MVGKITLITGPMFSGKTTELIRQCHRYIAGRQSVVVVKPKDDNRYCDDCICTHDRLTQIAMKAETMRDVYDTLSVYEVVAIDEGQFVSLSYNKLNFL